jgi:uncharacterized protein YecE (DUF72 family)
MSKATASARAHRNTAADGARTELRVGVAGWSYDDWKGVVYPRSRPRSFHEAAYLAEFFDTIEINTSFYRPLRPEHAAQWAEHVAHNPRFLFTAKLWQKFTHEAGATAADEADVRAGFAPLQTAGLLGAVLVQFPFAFHRTKENIVALRSLLQRFGDLPLVVEFRHATWNEPGVLGLLREHKAGFCNIDQPLIGRSLAPSAIATSEIGYLRLHGRRYDTWFSDDPRLPSFERYNYLYSAEELEPWAGRTQELSQETKRVFAIANNHYLGKAAVNALQFISLLKNAKVRVPEPLRQAYPALEAIASNPPETATLFPK